MNIRVSKTCRCCLETKHLQVGETDDANFINGMDAHKAFPYLSEGENNFLNTGFCWECRPVVKKETSEWFLKSDQHRVKNEYDCHGDCLSKGIDLFMSGKFGQAATYFEHVARSSRELQTMKNTKEMIEQADNMLSLMDDQEQSRRVWF